MPSASAHVTFLLEDAPAGKTSGRGGIGEECMKLTRRFVNSGLAASLAAPAILRRARAEDSTIKIGMVLPVTGPAADNGKYSLTGAKIASTV